MEELKTSRKTFNVADHEESDNYYDDECETCTVCAKDLILNKDSWYQCENWSFCSDCKDNSDKLFNKVTLIDRLSLTVEQTPLLWKCFKCKTKLGGSCKWYLLFNDMDVCEQCMLNEDKTFNSNLLNHGIHVSTNNTYLQINRTYESRVLLNVNDINNHEFTVPNEVIGLLTKEKHNYLIDLISELIKCNIDDSFLKWTLLTNLEGISFYSADTCLAIKCEHPYPIASLCADDHGRVSFDVIYDSYKDYCKEKNAWTPLNELELAEQTHKNSTKLHAGCEVSDEDCMKGSKSFSEYIRFKRDLGFYFG